jgi:hypothetical protein
MTTKALPTRQRIIRLDEQNGRIPLSLAEEMKIPKVNGYLVSVDMGTLANKDGLMLNPTTIHITKVDNFLRRVENQPAALAKKGSFSSRNRRSPAGDLIVSWLGESYALGKQGIISGGTTNLDHDKTAELEIILRILFALTLYELGKKPDEIVHISVAIPFISEQDFNRKDAKIRNVIGDEISWGTIDGSRKIKVGTLMISPEDYHAELFSRFYSEDSPNFEDDDRGVLGLGFRTCNLGFIAADGYWDSKRSLSIDGKGTSLFYQWIGEQIGVEDWNTHQFIQAVNNNNATFRPQGTDEELPLAEAIQLARGWYITEITKIVKKHTPSEINKLVITGGGAKRFGFDLINKLWLQSIVCPEADIANSAGQLIELALEI